MSKGLNADIIHGFTSSLLMSKFDNPVNTPAFHHELWELVTCEHPQVAIAAPRRHAKSTAITHCFTLAALLFRVKSYIIIVSNTEQQSIQFLNDIKTELVENEDLKALFKIKGLAKNNEKDIIVEFKDGGFAKVMAYGASAHNIRGRKWRNKRPDLVICDDLEDDETVMNEERRAKFRSWFMNALMEVGSVDCHFRVVGTILHQDSLLAGIVPSRASLSCKTDGLKFWDDEKSKDTGWLGVLYQAHDEDFKQILWPENYTEEFFRQKRSVYVAMGNPEGYSQEYLNKPIDDSVAYFRKEDLLPIPKDEYDSHGEYYVGADLAISTKDGRAFTALVVAKLLANGVLQIRDVRRFRGDSLDICNELFELQTRYNPAIFAIESENIAKSIGPFLYEQMGNGKPYLNLHQMPLGNQDKIRRARSIQARIRSGRVQFDHNASWWPAFLEEMLYFPRGTYMDQVDALAWVGIMLDKMSEVPTIQQMEEDRYEEELEQEYSFFSGKDLDTGY